VKYAWRTSGGRPGANWAFISVFEQATMPWSRVGLGCAARRIRNRFASPRPR
jgi:hypothetical protein